MRIGRRRSLDYSLDRERGIKMAEYDEVLRNFTQEAKSYLDNPGKVGDILKQIEGTLKELPLVGDLVSGVPLMVSMVKSWVTREYDVDPKVLATLVGAFLYLVKSKDLISDKIPVLGYADDIAILGLAFHFVSPELQKYQEWKKFH